MIPAIPDGSGYYCVTFGTHQWILRPVGSKAEDIVDDLATVMSLSRGSHGRNCFVVINNGMQNPLTFPSQDLPDICYVSAGESIPHKIRQLFSCASNIAFQLLPYGGFLIHGALIEKDGKGIILAGPSGMGKTTASQRIPPPWNTLSDDVSLIVNDENGEYIAYPWPTWGDSYNNNGPGGMWDTQKAVKLQALFFLQQSPQDSISTIDKTQSTSCMMECIRHVTPLPYNQLAGSSILKKINNLELIAVEQFIRSVPVFILHISLTGKFWEEIEHILENQESTQIPDNYEVKNLVLRKKTIFKNSSSSTDMFRTGHIQLVYSGSDMNPTLRSGDLLDIIPYQGQKFSVGDIICINHLKEKKKGIQRIIRTDNHGAWILGDNCQISNCIFVSYEHIIGRVVYAIRGEELRIVRSGWIGRITRKKVRIVKELSLLLSTIGGKIVPFLYMKQVLAFQLHRVRKPRFVLFKCHDWIVIKIFVGPYAIGQTSTKCSTWFFSSLFRLFINMKDLPTITWSAGSFHLTYDKSE